MATAQNDHEETCFIADYLRLPKETWREGVDLVQWKGFWLMPDLVQSVMSIQSQYKPLQSDIILASFPKTGTTWLKALTVTILSQNSMPKTKPEVVVDPLVNNNPHELVPFLELETFGKNPIPDIEKLPSPRVFNTHLPYSILPEHIKSSSCRIVYISRGPADTLVSHWHFFSKRYGTNISIEDAFEEFCNGFVPAGPFFDHVLEYWKVREKENVFFVTYEDLKEDPCKHVKRLAEFLGYSLDSDQIEQVVWKCSIERLSKLDVNKDSTKILWTGDKCGSFFRRGVIGDSKNHLSPEMVERLTEIANQKWEASGLVGSPLLLTEIANQKWEASGLVGSPLLPEN